MTAVAEQPPHAPERADTPHLSFAWRIAIGVLLVGGLALRIWTAFAHGGVLDADEAVVGLMARHPGQFSTFFWGQAYGGSHEPMLAAMLFRILGPTTAALRVLTILLAGVATYLCWRIARHFLDERRAALAAALFWIWPAAFVWWSVKLGSNYWASLCLAMSSFLVMLRLRERPQWPAGEVALLGALVGLSWWANPQVVYFIVPGFVLLAPAAVRHWRQLPLLALATVAGAAPWLLYNLRNEWQSLTFPGAPPGYANGYFDHLEGLFRWTLPMTLGLRLPFSRAWLFGFGASAVYGALLVAAAVAVILRPRRLRIPLLLLVAFPLLYAASPATWYVDQPRYVLFLGPTVCVLVAATLSSARTTAAVFTVASCLTVAGLWQINRDFLGRNYVPDVPVPASLAPLERLLSEQHIDRAFADYWLAYRITFEMRERALVTPVYTVRDRRIDTAVRTAERPAYIFVDGAGPLERLVASCRARGIAFDELRQDEFVVIRPAQRVLPEEVLGGWFPAA